MTSVPPLVLLLTLGTGGAAWAATPSELVPTGSSWAYLDDGVDPGATWVEPTFDDSAWSSGAAPLGYGIFGGTPIDYGTDPSNVHVTTWFRTTFSITDPADYTGLTMSLQRDDGAVVYLNGIEVHRSNLPAPSDATTLATLDVSGLEESLYEAIAVDLSLLVAGDNTVAVEVHQASVDSDDLAFDLSVTGWTGPAEIVRGPYLQNVTPDAAVLRWRTDLPTEGVVEIDGRTLTGPLATDHAIAVTGLSASTTYSYTVGTVDGVLSGDSSDPPHRVKTLPTPGSRDPIRLWVIGDSGTANADAMRVRDAFVDLGEPADVWLMLGDNAYNSGTDAEYQDAVFDIYDAILPNTPLWSTLGNHDGYSASSASQTGPYFDIFTLPASGEAGGEPSGTEAYYSFDVGNVHIVCLDSYDSDRQVGGAMLDWLEDDLSTTTADWVLAFWHHPPYSKGSHNSDLESNMVDMRENALPILEAYGVDLVMTGHSHSYERSTFIDGHYDVSSTFDPTMQRNAGSGDPTIDGAYTKPSASGGAHEGSVYLVAGSSGKTSGGPLDHPVMYRSLDLLGSVVLDIADNRLEARFLDDLGAVQDAFTIERGVTSVLEMSTDGPAREAEDVSLHAYAQDPLGNEAVAYVWDFGDGTPTATGADVVHLWPDDGTFPVTVTATDAAGDTAVRVLNLEVENVAPVITGLSAGPASEGVPVAMAGEATDVAADTVSLEWDFGDGTTAFGTEVEHVYLSDGTYTVVLTARDEDGGASTSSFEIVVADLPVEQQTIYVSAAFEGSVTVMVAGNDPEAVSWAWDLHDGLPARTSPTVEHIWTQDGPKPVTLTVTDAEGDEARTAISVTVKNVPPSDLTVSQPFGGDEGDMLAFTASATDPGDDVLDYTWFFGDSPFTAVGASVQHAFNDDGVFEVSVVVDDGDGGTEEVSFSVSIRNAPPRFTTFLAPTSLEEGELGTFVATGEDPGAYDNDDVQWDFGDGSGRMVASQVQRAFADEGVYTVTATLDDGDGAIVVETATVQVRNAPPTFLSSPPLEASVGNRYGYPASVDEPGSDALTYDLIGPPGASVDPQGFVSWVPARPEEQVPFTLLVGDGTETVAQSWTVDVMAGDPGGAATPSVRVAGGGGGCGCSSSTSSGFSILIALFLPWMRRR
jgi:PKD repeat protein